MVPSHIMWTCRGIGLGFVRRMLARGDQVVATARQSSSSKELRELEASAAGRLLLTDLDITQQGSVDAWAADLKTRVPHVDVRDCFFWLTTLLWT
jgi:NAD(P)-dependent dehydrogenase (short-subunit alcohol dehydrogenase family)